MMVLTATQTAVFWLIYADPVSAAEPASSTTPPSPSPVEAVVRLLLVVGFIAAALYLAHHFDKRRRP